MRASFCPMLRIIPVMASLTKGAEVRRVAVLRGMIQVGYRQYHPCRRYLQTVMVHTSIAQRMILDTAELTAVAGTFEYLLTNLFPVLRIAGFILRSYRHGYFDFLRFSRSCLRFMRSIMRFCIFSKMNASVSSSRMNSGW